MSEAEREQGSAIALADMIETLRQELEVAQTKGMGRLIAFGVEKVELELKVALSRKGKVRTDDPELDTASELGKS